jgi:ABC-type uncharacterized transport system permease subunit
MTHQAEKGPRTSRRISTVRWATWLIVAVVVILTVLAETTSLRDGPLNTFVGKGVLRFTLRAAVPLIFGALSGILCERSGIINIGIEGMMLAGAFGAFAVKSHTGSLPLPLSLFVATVSAILVGAGMGYLHALLSIRFRMNQIISGTIIIVLATGLSTYLFDPDWLSRGKFANVAIPLLSRIPVFGDILFTNGMLTRHWPWYSSSSSCCFTAGGVCERVLSASTLGRRIRWASM